MCNTVTEAWDYGQQTHKLTLQAVLKIFWDDMEEKL
jgi:hypothetical protein